MGRPILSASWVSACSAIVAQTLASVGPYSLKKRRLVLQFAKTVSEQISPPEMMTSKDGKVKGVRAARAEGTSAITLIARVDRVFSKFGPGSKAHDGAKHKAAPLHKAIKISKTEASKLSEANWRTRLCGCSAKVVICAFTKLVTPSCWIMTPLGLPVEPEV